MTLNLYLPVNPLNQRSGGYSDMFWWFIHILREVQSPVSTFCFEIPYKELSKRIDRDYFILILIN